MIEVEFPPSVKEPRESRLEKWKNYPRLAPRNRSATSQEMNVSLDGNLSWPSGRISANRPTTTESKNRGQETKKAQPAEDKNPDTQLKNSPVQTSKSTSDSADKTPTPFTSKTPPETASPPSKSPGQEQSYDNTPPEYMKPSLLLIGQKRVATTSAIAYELLLYLIFLILVCIIAFGMINPVMYYYSHALYTLFTSKKFYNESATTMAFNEINSVPDFWMFAKKSLLDTLFMEFDKQKGTNHFENKITILESTLVGQTRIRQVRVRNDSCKVPSGFERLFAACYDYYTDENRDTSPFGKEEGTAWTYNSESTTKSYHYHGRISTYGGGGYYVDLFKNFAGSKECVEDLWNNTWIDRGTRAVFIDFATYSPNVNLFCVVKLVAEFPPSGGVITSSHFTTLKLIRYLNVEDFIVLGVEMVFMCMVVYQTVAVSCKLASDGRRFFYKWWNMVEFVILAVSYTAFGLGLYLVLNVHNELKIAVEAMDEEDHYSFDGLMEIQTYFHTAIGILVFLVWIKALKYMILSKTTHHLQLSFAKCFKQLFGIAVASVIFMLAFAELGHILFGMEVEEFSTLGNALITLLLVWVGYFDYQKIEDDHRIMGAIYFALYIIFVPLFLISMFIAAIVYSYTEVGHSVFEKGDEIYLVDVLRMFYRKCLNKCCHKKEGQEPEAKPKSHKYEKNYKNISNLLWRAGFNEREIELFLKEYDITRDKPIDNNQMERMATDVDRRKHVNI